MHHTMKFDSVEFEEYHNLYYNFTINKTFFLLRVLLRNVCSLTLLHSEYNN